MTAANRLTALVVDDNAYARGAAAAALRQLGFGAVAEAESGAAAISHLLDARFDLMVMDWYMPEMSGAALLEVVRHPRFGSHATLPILLMTAYPGRETLQKARSLGANEVMVKPITAEQMAMALRRVLPPGALQPGDGGDAGKVFL